MIDIQNIDDSIFQAFFAFIMYFPSFVIVLIAQAIAKWNVFKKANEPGWAAFVPIYNKYISYKIAGRNKLFWAWLGLSLAAKVVYVAVIINFVQLIDYTHVYKYDEASQILQTEAQLVIGVIIIWAVMFAFDTVMYISFAQNFSRGTLFGIGLAIFPIIFMFVIVFSSKSQYINKQSDYDNYPNRYGDSYNQNYK